MSETSKLESIEKLREYAKSEDVFYQDVLDCADAIEREITERYMPLPLDNDGVPIHIGNMLEWCGIAVKAAGINDDTVWFEPYSSDQKWKAIWANTCHHVKPDQVSDLLNSFLREYDTSNRPGEEIIAEYAVMLRELLGGDTK